MIKRVTVGCCSIGYEGTPQEIFEYEQLQKNTEAEEVDPLFITEEINGVKCATLSQGGLVAMGEHTTLVTIPKGAKVVPNSETKELLKCND